MSSDASGCSGRQVLGTQQAGAEERRLLAVHETGRVETRVHADKLQGELMLNRALASAAEILKGGPSPGQA